LIAPGRQRRTWLASRHEKIILNMHLKLDRFLRG
jgi:hypothetical protein